MQKMLCVFALAVCGGSLHAQPARHVQTNAPTHPFQAPDAVPDVLQKIFSNLGPPSSAFTSSGWTVSGPASSFGYTQFIAMPFTPSANAHVQQARAAVQWEGTGADQVNFSIYSDNNGTPGTLLAGPVTAKGMPLFFTCCKLAAANFPNVPVAAGVRYWLVANTPPAGTGSDFAGAWAFVPPAPTLVGADTGGGWFSFPPEIQEPAGAILGSIP